MHEDWPPPPSVGASASVPPSLAPTGDETTALMITAAPAQPFGLRSSPQPTITRAARTATSTWRAIADRAYHQPPHHRPTALGRAASPRQAPPRGEGRYRGARSEPQGAAIVVSPAPARRQARADAD